MCGNMQASSAVRAHTNACNSHTSGYVWLQSTFHYIVLHFTLSVLKKIQLTTIWFRKPLVALKVFFDVVEMQDMTKYLDLCRVFFDKECLFLLFLPYNKLSVKNEWL